MKTLVLITILAFSEVQSKLFENAKKSSRYAFYRSMERDTPDGRRVFGGESVDLDEYPAAAALLDRYWTTRCSCAVISPFWALTAAHCVTSRVAYIKYNTRHPSSAHDGDSTPILYLYRHPNYKVVQEDEGRGMDVTLLHHDVGLIRARDKMTLRRPIQPINSMRQYSPSDLDHKELNVLGFGRTDVALRSSSDELFVVRLQMVFCERGAWFHCTCGVASAGGGGRGVCSGDSGGPVMYRGVQVAITSMGPMECATRSEPAEGSTSVFTSVYQYVDLINATITDTEAALFKSTNHDKKDDKKDDKQDDKKDVKKKKKKDKAIEFADTKLKAAARLSPHIFMIVIVLCLM